MRCPECGRELADEAKFCKYCGSPISVKTMDDNNTFTKCKSCGAIIKTGNSFCTRCGTPITTGNESRPRKGIGRIIIVLLTLVSILFLVFIVLFFLHSRNEESGSNTDTPVAANQAENPSGDEKREVEKTSQGQDSADSNELSQEKTDVSSNEDADTSFSNEIDSGSPSISDNQSADLNTNDPSDNKTVVVDDTDIISAKELGMSIPSDAITYNGHSYYLYDNDCENWDEILAFCEAKGGYPTVINESEENEILYEYMLSMGRKAAFIGYTDRDTEGLWKWIDGKTSDFTDWGTNNEGELEPNSDTKDEDYAQFDINMHDGHWNDCAFGWDTHSFICEWDGTN